jgi:hypothetical protein
MRTVAFDILLLRGLRPRIRAQKIVAAWLRLVTSRAAASRRRRTDELRNELEGIANALDRDDVDAARAKLQTLISTLHERKKEY